MDIIHDIPTLRPHIKKARQAGRTIGLVPTMGFLHEGHLSLLRRARAENDLTILSIFVNPLQFGASEDYEKYPRDLDSDAKMAASAGCDLIFAPPVREMYPTKSYTTFVDVKRLTTGLCGASRPDHFRGVTTVVAKLFNIVTPNRSYFGQKDAQQVQVLIRMVNDLNMDLEIIVLPIVREADGLAMSSRNTYLSPGERQAAPILYRSLQAAEEKIKNGERDAVKIRELIFNILSSEPLADIDYIAVVDAEELCDVQEIRNRTLIALAVRFGKTRLIDNLMVEA
ncbi:MAG TPA: pantoate--beta-alanine ligase [Atribacteraceae bacterium]|nr:pantoate--beta-alanine ligase [Atribacteraceae bacterium]